MNRGSEQQLFRHRQSQPLLGETMGSTPSKVDQENEGQPDDNHKEADQSEPKPSLDETSQSQEEQGSSHSEEKKEMEITSTQSATPRTNPKLNGMEAQSRAGTGGRQVAEGRDDVPRRPRILDDQVHVNLPMADLMAYLQVVANNSNNLPLTRRDDPELGRIVSTLTSEDFARKSAAFIPADVRVIGGSFTKYGRVWDLPTSDEYNAQDGAQEPGQYSELWLSFSVAAVSSQVVIYRSFVRRRVLQCHVKGALRCGK